MDREGLLAWLEGHGLVPAVTGGSYPRVEPSVDTCQACGGYRSLYLPGLADDGSGCWRASGHYVAPALALAYAAYADELREAAGLTPYRQQDRGACTCTHDHRWEHVAKLGNCLNRYRCTVDGCDAAITVDSSD